MVHASSSIAQLTIKGEPLGHFLASIFCVKLSKFWRSNIQVTTATMSTSPTLGKNYFIESQLNGKVASLYGGNVGNEVNIAVYTKGEVGSIDNQVWYLQQACEGYYYITSKANNRVMGIYGCNQIRSFDKADGEASQQWKFCQDGSIYFIESRSQPGQVMSVVSGAAPRGGTLDWVNLEAKKTIGNDNQEWKLQLAI
jgi:hypothetical protein